MEDASGISGDRTSALSIKQHHSRIQMDYYEEARQYNALEVETFKYPTRTHLVQGQSPQAKGLRFTELRERPNIDVGMMPYQD